MSKRELIDQIRLFNPTAASSFLAEFGEADLQQYLGHLLATCRQPLARTVRQPVLAAAADGPPQSDPRQLALVF